jgi:hypothetical protein
MAESKKTLAQQANSLITLFVQKYRENFGKDPEVINRYRDKWGFQSMIEDLGYARSVQVIEYYMHTNRPIHDVTSLFNNYDRLDKIMKEKDEDERRRKILMEESRLRVQEWRAKNGN